MFQLVTKNMVLQLVVTEHEQQSPSQFERLSYSFIIRIPSQIGQNNSKYFPLRVCFRKACCAQEEKFKAPIIPQS